MSCNVKLITKYSITFLNPEQDRLRNFVIKTSNIVILAESFRQLHLTSLVRFRLHGSNASLQKYACLQDYVGSAYFGLEESVNNTNLSLRKVIL